MAAQGKTIRIYLVDAVPNGVMTAEIMNWTGKVIIAPRSQLPKLADRQEAKRTGLYILVGDDPEVPSKERVYVGESDNVFKRLIQHHTDESKDFWTRAVLVISGPEQVRRLQRGGARLESLERTARGGSQGSTSHRLTTHTSIEGQRL